MKKIFIFLLAAANLAGCATSHEERAVNEKVAAEKPAVQPGELGQRSEDAFATMPGITEQQRQSLLVINAQTGEKARRLQAELTQAKSALFHTLATPNYKAQDVDLLKKKITKLDNERLNLMFESLERVENVLGRNTAKEKFYTEVYLHQMER